MAIIPTRLIDTCVFIDHLRGSHQIATKWILDATSGIDPGAFSVLTDAELWAGLRSHSDEKVHRVLLSKMRRLPLIVPIARRAGELRQQHRQIKLPDLIIAATAEYHRLPLYTNNTKDFINISSITVVDYS